MNDVADLRLLASLDRACDCGVDGPIYAPLHEGPCQHDAARQKIANLGGWKGISIQQAAEITRLRAELAEAKESAKPAHAVGFAAGIEAAARIILDEIDLARIAMPSAVPILCADLRAILALTPPDITAAAEERAVEIGRLTARAEAAEDAATQDWNLLLDAYKGLLVLHRILDKAGLAAGADATNSLADRIVSAHPEMPALAALRALAEVKP